jgi:hypothetical protein
MYPHTLFLSFYTREDDLILWLSFRIVEILWVYSPYSWVIWVCLLVGVVREYHTDRFVTILVVHNTLWFGGGSYDTGIWELTGGPLCHTWSLSHQGGVSSSNIYSSKRLSHTQQIVENVSPGPFKLDLGIGFSHEFLYSFSVFVPGRSGFVLETESSVLDWKRI